MKKASFRLLGLVLVFLFSQALSAQTGITGTVTTSQNQPLGQTNIMVFNASDSSLVSFATTRQDGSYQIPKLRPGLYYLEYAAVGYQNEKSDPIRISAGRKLIKMPPQVLVKRKTKTPLVKPARA